MEKFTIKDFNAKYPTDEACLQEIYNNRYGNRKHCPSCLAETKFHRVTDRKCWACQWCGHQLHPLSGTIFHKSETSLKTWFFAIFLFANSKNGVSAKELQRQTGVTYKTAWRMANQIRKLFGQDKKPPLKNTVEIDETFMGGKKEGVGSHWQKTPVIGAVERKAEVRADVIRARYASQVQPFIRENVDIKATIYTDDWPGYRYLSKKGFSHDVINHSQHRYAQGIVHTNTIEGFWSQLKRGIDGTYHHVSPYYLQSYVDEFCYRYNLRHQNASVFSSMISEVAKPS